MKHASLQDFLKSDSILRMAKLFKRIFLFFGLGPNWTTSVKSFCLINSMIKNYI